MEKRNVCVVNTEYVIMVERDSMNSKSLKEAIYVASEICHSSIVHEQHKRIYDYDYFVLNRLSSNHPEINVKAVQELISEFEDDNYQIIRTKVERYETRYCYTLAEAAECCDSPDQYSDYENGESETFNRIYCLG